MQPRNRAVKTARIGLAMGIALAIVAAVPAAAVTLKNVRGFPTQFDGAISADRVYDVESDISVFCGGQGNGTPIAAGWTDAGVLIHSIDDRYNSTNDYLRISPRLPMKTTTIRPLAICVKGAIKATVKTAKGKGPVDCGSKLAIGMPLSSTWPYNDERAVMSKPVGKHKWVTDAPFSDSRAVCVAASAFGKVKTVKRTASFASGRTSAKVSATCPGARRPIGWGYSAPLMTGNTWESSESDSALAVPFVSGSAPKGKQGWSLVFRTPDARPAVAAAQLGIYVTCAVPR